MILTYRPFLGHNNADGACETGRPDRCGRLLPSYTLLVDERRYIKHIYTCPFHLVQDHYRAGNHVLTTPPVRRCVLVLTAVVLTASCSAFHIFFSSPLSSLSPPQWYAGGLQPICSVQVVGCVQYWDTTKCCEAHTEQTTRSPRFEELSAWNAYSCYRMVRCVYTKGIRVTMVTKKTHH